jgi:hypothetical protein
MQLPDRKTALPSRPAVSQRSLSHMSHMSLMNLAPDDNAENDFETAFFLRHYSEGPGLWYVFFLLLTWNHE